MSPVFGHYRWIFRRVRIFVIIALLLGLLVGYQASPSHAQSSSPPLVLKQDAITFLQQISSDDKKLRKTIDKAIDEISRSLSDKGTDLFLDGSRIRPPPEGNKVFKHEKEAVKQLTKAIKDKKTPAQVREAFEQVIGALLEADRGIAQLSLETAQGLVQAGQGDRKDAAKAQKEFDKALKETDPKKGIGGFEKAWELSQKVVKAKGMAIATFADAPDPFAPSLTANTLTATFEIFPKDLKKNNKYFLELHQVIQSSADGTSVRTLITDHEVPIPSRKGKKDLVEVVATSEWDGRDSAGANVPDGEYSYLAFGKLIKVGGIKEKKDKKNNKEKEKIEATSFPVLGAFTVDNTPPVIEIISPGDGETFATPNINVTGTVNDALSGIASVTCNDIPATVSDSTFTCDIVLTEGANTIVALATDQAGNQSPSSISLSFNPMPIPEVSITSPANLSLFSSSPITVSGTVEDTVIAVEVNGIPATLGAGTFTVELPVREGNNTITAAARNALGGVGTDSIRVVLDTTPPTVVIKSPRDGLVTTQSSVSVAGSVNDMVTGTVNGQDVSISCNEVAASVRNRSFLASNLALRPGPNTIRCSATDAASNSSNSQEVQVTRQNLVGQFVELVSGDGQTGVAGAELPDPLVARVKDTNGNPIAGQQVNFQVTDGGGTLRNSSQGLRNVNAVSNANGEATVFFTLGSQAGVGNHKVTANAVGFVREVVFLASATADNPDKILAIAGGNQRGAVGNNLPLPFVALVLDPSGNPLENVPVTFTVVQGGGNINGGGSSITNTDDDGRVTAALTLGPDAGVNNNIVQADFAGNPGLPASFVASADFPGLPQNTSVRGVVLDNSNVAIPGVTVLIKNTALQTLSDSEGQFSLLGVPVGAIVLRIDGGTSPRPETFPALEFDLTTIAGQDNDIGMPILLPALDTQGSQVCGGNTDCVLPMANVPGMELRIFANSVTFSNGSRVGTISFTQVQLDKVPMPPPDGSVFIPAWTIQPAGVQFDPPARITLPNTDGLPSGESAEIFQFDHDLMDFISIGPGTVSDDGSVIASDPGFGITKSGWGGRRQNPPPTGDVDNSGDALTNDAVRDAFENAWNESNPGPNKDPNRREQGGWLIRDPDGTIRIERWPALIDASGASTITPTEPPEGTIGGFHTHPNTGPNWEPRPSGEDANEPGDVQWVAGDPDVRAPHYVISDDRIFRINADGSVDDVGPRVPAGE